KLLRDRLVRTSLEEARDQEIANLGRKLEESLIEGSQNLVRLEIGRAILVAPCRAPRGHARLARSPSSVASDPVARAAHGERVEERSHGPTNRDRSSHELEEAILRDVLGVMDVSKDAPTGRKDEGRVPGDELGESGWVAI